MVFSKSTDPLWPAPASLEKRVEAEVYGQTIRTMSSMIVHKMVTCSLVHVRLSALSPNVRVESVGRASAGVHAYEFTQWDFEVGDSTSDWVREFVEQVLCGLVYTLKSARIPLNN